MDDSSNSGPTRADHAGENGPAESYCRLWDDAPSPPDLDGFLHQAGPLPHAQLAAVLRADQRRRWQVGQRLPAEFYLRRYPAIGGDTETALDLIYGEYLLRERLGPPRAPRRSFSASPSTSSCCGPSWSCTGPSPTQSPPLRRPRPV